MAKARGPQALGSFLAGAESYPGCANLPAAYLADFLFALGLEVGALPGALPLALGVARFFGCAADCDASGAGLFLRLTAYTY